MYGILMFYISYFLWGGEIWLHTELLCTCTDGFCIDPFRPLCSSYETLSTFTVFSQSRLPSPEQATVLEREKGTCVPSEVKNVILEAFN